MVGLLGLPALKVSLPDLRASGAHPLRGAVGEVFEWRRGMVNVFVMEAVFTPTSEWILSLPVFVSVSVSDSAFRRDH